MWGNLILKLNTMAKNNPGIWVAAGLMIALPIAYTNCSAQMAFEMSEDSLRSALNSSGSVVINNGADFTNSKNVILNISHISATQMYVTDDPTCASGGTWEPISSMKAWELKDRNQQVALYAKFTNENQSSVESECLSDSIIHDDIAPTLSVGQPAAFTNLSNIEVAIAATDSGSGIDRSVCVDSQSNASVDCGAKLVVAAASEGAHAYDIAAVDRAGNKSPSQNVAFVVDRTAPTVALNLTPSKISNAVSSEFRFTGADGLSGIDRLECRLGAAPFAACVSPLMQNHSQGAQHFEVRSIDRAGNTSSPAVYDWTIDSSAPTVTITKMPSSFSNSAVAQFEFVGVDDGQPLNTFECRLDSAAAVPCTSPTNYTSLSAGNHTFSVIGIDGAGNRSAAASYTWMVDTTPPTVTIVSAPDVKSAIRTGDFLFSAADSGSGVDVIECRLDSDAFAACGSTKSFANLTEGAHVVEVRSKDRAGNLSSVATHRWTVDTMKPVVTITSGPNPYVNVKVATIAFTITDADASATAECRVDSGSYAACASPKLLTDLAAGSHTIWIRAKDSAGNMSAEVSRSWSIDLTPPAINIGQSPLPILYTGAEPEIAFTATDAGSGLDTVLCGLQAAQQNCAATYSYKFPKQGPGSYVYLIKATDKAGNEATQTIAWSVTNNVIDVNQNVSVNRSNKLDILVVIDNSGSMNTEQANMASRFGTFLDQLSGIDWQLGIVSTDVDSDADKKDGRLIQFENGSGAGTGQYTISSAMPIATAKSWFGDTIQRPTNEGSGNEQGVAAAYRALQRSQQTGNSISLRNAALFRADAALAVLVVTDADETNPKGTQVQNKPETLIGYVKSLWSSKPFSFHSIIVPIGDSQCKSINGNESYGYNYDTLSQLTGGIRGTVCASDYSVQLKNIGQSTQDLITSVSLNCTPVDQNNDGQPDIQIVTADGSPAPTFVLEGMRLKLSAPLPVGANQVRYMCPAI